ncbi:mynd finger protein [Rhizoctonia solani AG-3 Rhs1AP]|uniref:Mynd finger protein n=1 Tax=Rhizoctonia solani AG-3 Rhs1AP TaxID=1086054 RepID=X8IXJ5_9AGAM|nr:mynd finger protein [Rhizoctonia solani AG-3 Rhs1AP]
MSHPPFWLSKQFFYPIGNTAAISLTQDLSPEQSAADILLLGCGDPRNIIFTLYSDLMINHSTRKLDITCCDIEPAILARNIILFSLLDQNENIDRVWDIFYHFKIDDRALKIITNQSRTLYEHAENIDTWRGSPFGSFLKMVDTRTLKELRRQWENYVNFPNLPADRKSRIIKQQVQQSKSSAEIGSIAISPSRSAGMLWPQAMKPVSELFRKYWETGTTFTLASDIKRATNLNPTFVYSLSGEGFNPHYGTFPLGFHLISAFAPIKSDPAGPTSSTGSAAISTSKQQFAAWCKAFREARKTESIVVRFFTGDAILFCRALDRFATTGNPSTDIFVSAYRAAQINFDGATGSDLTPANFDVIDTSNLTDHLGLFNLLLVTHGLLKKSIQSQAVLYTETLLPFGKDTTKSFLERIFADVPTVALLFGIAPRPYVSNFTTHSNAHEIIFSKHLEQYHERVAWSNPSGGDNLVLGHEAKMISVEADSLTRVLYGIYDKMFANEKVTSMMSSLSSTPNGLRVLGTIHFHRETVALLFQALHRRIHLVGGDWEQVANTFMQKCRLDRSRIVESNCHQDICLQLHLYGISTVDTLKPNWATDQGLRINPRNALFDGWRSLPPVVCVVLTVPRQRLGVFVGEPDRIGSPTLICAVWVPGSHDNTLASIHLAWGKCVTSAESDRVVIEEDANGQRGQSDLLVSFWVSTRILEFPDTQIALRLQPTPQTTMAFMKKLGMYLEVFGASVLDKKHVQVLAYRPALATVSSPTPPSDPSIPPVDFCSDQLCQAIVSNPQSHQLDSLSIRFDVTSQVEQDDLLKGALVSANQVSACAMQLNIGAHSHSLSYPYPIHGKDSRLRIARKSRYVEVIVPVSTPNDYSGYFLNPSPIINPGAYTTWNLHHVNLDRLPTLDVANPAKVDWLDALCAAATFRERERHQEWERSSEECGHKCARQCQGLDSRYHHELLRRPRP